jgi:hypothetical protein
MRGATLPRIETSKEARALLEAKGVITMTPTGELTSIVESVAGERVKGSWWGHPAGKRIFRVASELEDMDGVLVTKLVAGKATFVDRALWGPLYRIVTDRTWRKKQIERSSRTARALLESMPSKGSLHTDQMEKKTAKAKGELEKSMLVHSASVHTEKGSHSTMLTAWPSWADAKTKRAAGSYALVEAIERIREAVAGEPCVLIDMERPRARRGGFST